MEFFKPRPEHKPGSRARLMRIEKEMEEGFRFMELFDEVPVVTFYGGSRAKPEDSQYKQAYELGNKLAKDDFAIVTGGGPGIMEAGNKGAYDAKGISIGLGIVLDNLDEEPNPYMTHSMNFYYFFARKTILAHIAQAYVYFPGGLGTMDEFFKLATLIATKKLAQDPKVILIDSNYWKGLFAWMKETCIDQYKALNLEELDKYIITDDIEEAYKELQGIPMNIGRADSL